MSGAGLSRLISIGAALTCLFLYAGTYTFPGGASQFTQYADALAHGGHLHPRLAQRDVGFPLLLWLSGYPYTGSFIGITLLQAVFSLLMPVMIYLIFGDRYPRAAFYTALLSIVSLAPYQFVKWIHHDHAYLFFIVVTMYFGARFARTSRPLFIYLMTFAVIAAGLTRPAGNWMLPLLLVGVLVLNVRQWKHYIACAVIFICVCFGYQAHRTKIFDVKPGESMPSYTGQQILYNLYINSRELGVTLSPDTSPGLHALTEKLRAAISPHPMESVHVKNLISSRPYTPEFTKAAFEHPDADSFIKSFFEHPSYEYYELLSTIAQNDDRTFLKASWEVACAYPFYTAHYVLRNLYYTFAAPGYSHSRDSMRPMERGKPQLLPGDGGVWSPQGVPERGVRELSHAPLKAELSWFKYPFKWLQNFWRPIYIVITLATLAATLAGLLAVGKHVVTPYIERREWETVAAPFLLIFIILFYNAAVTAAFVDPVYRYHYFIILPQIVCGGFGALLAWHYLQRRKGLLPADIPFPAPQEPGTLRRPLVFSGAVLLGWVAFLLLFY